MSLRLQQKAVIFSGLAYILVVLFHVPNDIFPHGFDKNAPVQFLSLLFLASTFLIYISIKSERFVFSKILVMAAGFLLATQFASVLMSGSLIGSLVGDTGRFVGTLSLISLLVISIFHTQFKLKPFISLLRFYVFAIESVVIVGFAQHFDWIELPGDHGMTSTLGNLDFFAAYVGTSLPLILLLAFHSSRRGQILLAIAGVVNIIALYIAGPLQGYLDIAFLLAGLTFFAFRKHIPRPTISINKKTFLGTFAIIIWAEFIFLFPFIAHFVPVLGNDVQVKIRSNFWLAGMRQFFAHPILGVGPDQYGNNYEQYRTIEDVVNYTNILSNDAHSASVQTLATVGILGTAAFIFLLALVVRSILILWDSREFDRKSIFVLSLYIFIYLTNSFVSPFTLTHKYIFWAVCGFVVGQAFRMSSKGNKQSFGRRTVSIIVAGLLIFSGISLTQAQLNFLRNIESYAEDNSVVLDYKSSSLLPCVMYFDAELLMTRNSGTESAMKLAEEELANNPRCVAAQIFLTQSAVDSGDLEGLKPLIYKLLEIAPARNDSLSMGMYYANRAGDLRLLSELDKRMKALGLVYIPGQLG